MIKPYHETEHGVLYHGDCLEIMPMLADKSVDLVLTDPPYGIGRDKQNKTICKNPKHNRKQYDCLYWDSKTPDKGCFDLMQSISINQIIWGGNYFVQYLKPSMGWLVWDKGQHGLSMSDGELAYSSFQKALRIIELNRVEILKDGAEHPTQKPVALFSWCLNNYSEPNQLILDPFAGSGTTAVACINTKRRYILIEKEEKYCEITAKRIETTLDQTEIEL